MTRDEEQRIRNEIRKSLFSDEAMTRFLDDMFGAGSYTYDPAVDLWVTADPDYSVPDAV